MSANRVAALANMIEHATFDDLSDAFDSSDINPRSPEGFTIDQIIRIAPLLPAAERGMLLARVAERLGVGGELFDALDGIVSVCPICGFRCKGHNQILDPEGFDLLTAHDHGDHSACDLVGCNMAGAHA